MKIFFFVFILIISFSEKILAFPPELHLAEEDEIRARNLFLQVKCPVCQGQVIESSDTEIAYELRQLIRKKITEGQSDEEIKFYIISKFGPDAVNSPPLNFYTFFLWFLPMIFIIFSLFLVWKFRR